jgi:hypothetical protein
VIEIQIWQKNIEEIEASWGFDPNKRKLKRDKNESIDIEESKQKEEFFAV